MSFLPPKTCQVEEELTENLPGQSETEKSLDLNRRIVFRNLLRKILEELDSKNLCENVRLVSKCWRDDATALLRKRLDSFSTSFKFDQKVNNFVLCSSRNKKENGRGADSDSDTENGDKNGRRLSILTELLSSCPSTSFPSAHFEFIGGSLDCPEALDFFSVYGQNVQKLTVDVRENPPTADGALRRKIFKLTSKLESLELVDPNEGGPSLDLPLVDPLSSGSKVILGQGQCQLLDLKNLKFTESLEKFKSIQSVLQHLQPEIPPSCFVSLESLAIYETNLDPEYPMDPEILNPRIVHEVKSMALSIFCPLISPVYRLEQLAQCQLPLRKVYFLSELKPSKPPPEIPPRDLVRIGRACWKILEGAKESLKLLDCSGEILAFLTRQPFTPGFFRNLKVLSLSFKAQGQRQGPGQGQGGNEVNINAILPRSDPNLDPEARDPPLWKNLSEIMPSLFVVILDGLFDVEGDPWLPFLHPDAGQNLTVQRFIAWEVRKREILPKIISSFPSIRVMNISISSSSSPPDLPASSSSWTNLFHWLFQKGKNEDEETEKPEFPISLSFSPFSTLKYLNEIWVDLKSCNAIQEDENTLSSQSVCSLSEITGSRWFQTNTDRKEWWKISEQVYMKEYGKQENSSHFSTIMYIKIICGEHNKE